LGGYTITVCNQPTRLTQPCIPPGSLNRVPASDGGKGWNVTSAGWQVTLCDPIWHVSSSGGEACCELLYPAILLLRKLGPSGGACASRLAGSPMMLRRRPSPTWAWSGHRGRGGTSERCRRTAPSARGYVTRYTPVGKSAHAV